MRPSLVRVPSLVGLALLAAASPARAQRRGDYVECFRDGRRVSCDDVRDDRDRDRERERALERARVARDQALERSRVERERALERARVQRERDADVRRRELERQLDRQRDLQRERSDALRRDAERRRVETLERQRALDRAIRARRRWYDDSRTTVGLGGGADIRRFADVNRYFGNASVDFRSRSGIGLRPEVVYAWSDRQTLALPLYVSTCPTCSAVPPIATTTQPLQLRTRSQMLGVDVNGTYTFLRGSMVRPYMLAGVGVLSTRETRPTVASSVPLPTFPTYSQVTYATTSTDHVDLGLNAGSGLEFGRGPLRLYVEFRYLLNDTPSTQGFSGALPITAGLRF